MVPEGFGIAYVTGFDGKFYYFIALLLANPTWQTDFLQFTITSRAEMPNAEFASEIEKAAEDVYALFAET